MKVGDLVQMSIAPNSLYTGLKGIGVIVEFLLPNTKTEEREGGLVRIHWGSDPELGTISPDEWLYYISDVEEIDVSR